MRNKRPDLSDYSIHRPRMSAIRISCVLPYIEHDARSNLVASGVLMEAEFVEDNSEGVQFCDYCYNVQDGITIDYAAGANYANNLTQEDNGYSVAQSEGNSQETISVQSYVLNTNTKKFHYSL